MSDSSEEPEILKKRNPLDEIIEEISKFLRLFHESKTKKIGPPPEHFLKELEALSVHVQIFNILHAHSLKEIGVEDSSQIPEKQPRNLDPKSKRQLARLKKLSDEVSVIRQALAPPQASEETKQIKGFIGKAKAPTKDKKKSIGKHFGLKGWKKV